ncbi:hypothetical protein K438DRAFT_2015600 [Mycena galopus ATCC 62051]|nr:hypothetical protein K438DRAFT_2015600 [Mycena galopus ATCC 62051]
MSHYQNATIIDLLDGLDLDLDTRGFTDFEPDSYSDVGSEPSLLFGEGTYYPEPFISSEIDVTVAKHKPLDGYGEPSTSALVAAEAELEDESEFEFELLDEPPLSPRKWVASGPPLSFRANVPEPVEAPFQCVAITRKNLIIRIIPSDIKGEPDIPHNSRLYLGSPTTPIERAFARLRARGSSLALNSLLPSAEILHGRRVLV